jgi:hypothetical protein
MADHKVLVGLTYAGKRVKAGEVVSDIPSRSVPWLVEQGVIEPVEGKSIKKREHESPKKEA